MKIVQINSVCGVGSTGRIAEGIQKVLNEKNIENYIFYGNGHTDNPQSIRFGNDIYLKFNILKTRIFGKHGFYSYFATKKMLKKLEEIKPDIIHLHNIHGHYLNVKLLFNYIKQNNIKVVWTLHDCWTFTGHCAHFDYVKCDKWKSGCYDCPQLKEYPKSWLFDRSKTSYKDKKELFCDVSQLQIVTPSIWLSDLVKQSFLKEYNISVINNGIDINDFSPTNSDLKTLLNIENKFVVLGICFNLHDRKGGQYLIKLAKKLPEDCVMLIVGLDKQSDFPNNVICLPKTSNKKELAQIYTIADVYVNTTLEDTFPTVNLESLACGTPVVTFDTGGSPESLDDTTGIVVEQKNVQQMYDAVIQIKDNIKINYSENCKNKAFQKYDETVKFKEYLYLYDSLSKKT